MSIDNRGEIDHQALFASLKEGVTEESPASASEQAKPHEPAIPYERFNQELQARRELEQKHMQLLEQLARQNATSQGVGYQQAQEQAQVLTNQVQQLLTPDEKMHLDTIALTNPGDAYETAMQLVYERGVKVETAKVEQRLRAEMQGYVNQFAQQMAPMQMQNFESQHYAAPEMQPVQQVFRQLVQQEQSVNPSVVNNPQQLELLHTIAVGKAYQQGLLGQTQAAKPAFSLFSESPSAPGFNAKPQGHQAPADALKVARLLGVDQRAANAIDDVFVKQGVYRHE